MKKTALLLVFIFIIALCGCGDKKDVKKELEVDIEYYSKLGQMPECEYKLGDSIDELEKLAKESEESEEHNHDNIYYNIVDMDDYSVVYAGDEQYFYKSENKDDGIAVIASMEGGYGFEAGSVSVEISNELAAAGYEAEEKEAEKEDVFFMPSNGKFTVLKYEFSGNIVRFIFEDNVLCACSLSAKDWSI